MPTHERGWAGPRVFTKCCEQCSERFETKGPATKRCPACSACEVCGKPKWRTTGIRINAHHIWPWAEHPELRYDVSNGVTLCVSCHTYGARRVTNETLTTSPVWGAWMNLPPPIAIPSW
jgi:hypothetical protein